jgi:hypothetical protein
MLHFQNLERDTAENDENLDYDSDFDDLEELLSELIKHKVSSKVYFMSCTPAIIYSRQIYPGECGTMHAC